MTSPTGEDADVPGIAGKDGLPSIRWILCYGELIEIADRKATGGARRDRLGRYSVPGDSHENLERPRALTSADPNDFPNRRPSGSPNCPRRKPVEV